jgi:hypothetical protein
MGFRPARTAIVWVNHRTRFDHALGIEAPGFSDGAFSGLPERPAGQDSRR